MNRLQALSLFAIVGMCLCCSLSSDADAKGGAKTSATKVLDINGFPRPTIGEKGRIRVNDIDGTAGAGSVAELDAWWAENPKGDALPPSNERLAHLQNWSVIKVVQVDEGARNAIVKVLAGPLADQSYWVRYSSVESLRPATEIPFPK